MTKGTAWKMAGRIRKMAGMRFSLLDARHPDFNQGLKAEYRPPL
jgi:hypothetical protein